MRFRWIVAPMAALALIAGTTAAKADDRILGPLLVGAAAGGVVGAIIIAGDHGHKKHGKVYHHRPRRDVHVYHHDRKRVVHHHYKPRREVHVYHNGRGHRGKHVVHKYGKRGHYDGRRHYRGDHHRGGRRDYISDRRHYGHR